MRDSDCAWCHEKIVVEDTGLDFCDETCMEKFWHYVECAVTEHDMKGTIVLFDRFIREREASEQKYYRTH